MDAIFGEDSGGDTFCQRCRGCGLYTASVVNVTAGLTA